jgi:hypothetical protein
MAGPFAKHAAQAKNQKRSDHRKQKNVEIRNAVTHRLA